MVYHFIVIISHYADGHRICWHYAKKDTLDRDLIKTFFKKVKEKCGDVQFGVHRLITDSTSWDSVIKKDAYFKDIICIEDIDAFIELVSADQQLSASDVAKFVLALVHASHLKLQKLIYFSYADFLKKTGKKLFSEPIVAYKYGPVVEDVFYKYRIHGRSIIDYAEDSTIQLRSEELAVTPSFMKIVLSKYGIFALKSILCTIKKYGKYSASKLVDITHKDGGPWKKVYEPGKNRIITDQIICKYHKL